MGKGKRGSSRPTEKAALDHVEGKVKEHQLSSIAEKLQRQQRIREELHRRQEQARTRSQGDDGGSAA